MKAKLVQGLDMMQRWYDRFEQSPLGEACVRWILYTALMVAVIGLLFGVAGLGVLLWWTALELWSWPYSGGLLTVLGVFAALVVWAALRFSDDYFGEGSPLMREASRASYEPRARTPARERPRERDDDERHETGAVVFQAGGRRHATDVSDGRARDQESQDPRPIG